jgi:hypothetical protein
LLLFTDTIALPPNAICIKCYDIELHTNSGSHFASLSAIFVMIIILSFLDSASLSTVMICCTTVATFLTCHFYTNREPALTDLFSEFPVVAAAAARGAESFSHFSAVPVAADVACLDAVRLRRTALVMWT